ncbi:hypothetical protein PsorP6_012090 [Peronosclerospora sorghi]|uniref:Uncharacterized protein n=1 Tax=Peronosclerospora sorghi TaxID=230839 RepID=A0ACC0WJP8_9STRA|nr:hypothetical protein PsorP6_012090 [Peronosclerospora sorghi]
MAHSLRSLRLRWIIALLAAGVIFVLSDILVTWQQLLTLKGPSTWPSLSTRGASRASVATLHALKYTAFSSMDPSHVQLLYNLIRRSTETRGIVVPLNSATASQGLSLVMELRSLDVTWPVEMPHCGDLDQKWITSISKKEKELGRLYVYDVCKMAFIEKTRNQSIFCNTLEACYDRFRTLDLPVLAVIYSRFEELVLLGANTLLLQSPLSLWETTKYRTGTLFFNDRVSETNTSLSYRPASRPHVTDLRHYLSNVNVSVFRHVPTIPRPKATVVCDMVLPFEPSDMLLKSHAWNGRSSHQLDSSLLLWSKKQQPRATVVLAAFLLRNGLDRPPFSGVNELFFVACELAETQYSFSELAQGAAGNDFRDHGAEKSIICGFSTQFYPVKQEDASYASLLFLNSDAFMKYEPRSQPMYFSKARAASVYYGSHSDLKVPPSCSINATGVALSERQIQRVLLRQGLHAIAAEWEWNALTSESERATGQADEVTRKKLETLMKRFISNGESSNKSAAAPATSTSPVAAAPMISEPSPVIALPSLAAPAAVPVAAVPAAKVDPQTIQQSTSSVKFRDTESERAAQLNRRLESELLYSLHTISQQTSRHRGIVLPLYDKITTLGVSLILQLRSLGVDLPIEIPHCGDFNESYGAEIMQKGEQLGEVYVYNACQRAVTLKSLLDPRRALFCNDIEYCYRRFRWFPIKVLGVILSRFEESMLMDADALLFQSPMQLWETEKYRSTGTLFFNDRIVEANFTWGLGYRPANRPNITAIEDYLSKANVELFRGIPTLSRPHASAELIAADKSPVTLHFQPSESLLKSHVWARRSGHLVDSSILLWNKKRQPRATAILASFISLNNVQSPPSYGDKDLFFVACELAETQYSLSEFGTGAAGFNFQNHGANKSVICGSAAQYYPERYKESPSREVALLYMNTKWILEFKPREQPLYYSVPRPHDFYPGSNIERNLPIGCHFDVTGVKLSESEVLQVYRRQHFHRIATEWEVNANRSDLAERAAADMLTNEKLKSIMEVGYLFDDRVNPPKTLSIEEQGKKAVELKNRVAELRDQEKQLVYTLNQIGQQTTVQRGIIIPVHDEIIKLAMSLVLELRTFGITEPIEMPYCGNLNQEVQAMYLSKKEVGMIWFDDVCARAAESTSRMDPSRSVFCQNIDECYTKLRTFIKPLSMIFSRFEEIMMVDPDTTFFLSPAKLWETEKYQRTGTLLMHDRLSHETMYMAKRVAGRPDVSVAQVYLSHFDVKPFQSLPTLQRPRATLPTPTSVPLNFVPSDFLLKSHSFNARAGHQVDASLLLWNKRRQARATAVLASFLALNDIALPPSDGDKELYFYASEVAETQYAFSDYAIGAIGTNPMDRGPQISTLCGDVAHVFPIRDDYVPDDSVPLFYVKGDHILSLHPNTTGVYYTKARAWDVYPGPFRDRPAECPFNITLGRLTNENARHLEGRQHLYDVVDGWQRVAREKPANLNEQNAALDDTLRQVMEEIQGGRKSPPIVPFSRRESPYTDDVVRLMEQQLAYTLSQITQQTTTRRGLVIPLYEPIARNGFSLILELRAMGITLPIEVPYCGDLQPRSIELLRTKTELGAIRTYDVCDLAARATSLENAPVFCDTLATCHTKFRSFIIKPLAVTYSQFEQILMLDADTTYFINPTVLFDSDKFQRTGILLMHDRIVHDWWYLAERVEGKPERSVEQVYFATFNVTSFRPLPTLERPKASVENKMPVTLAFEPSDFLLRSHSFNLRTGHQVDSSLVLWNKHRQPRATAILASFLRHNEMLPPSYGDKELFFYASELAETLYAFSDHAISAVGTKLTDGGPKNSTLCGRMAQVFPIHRDDVRDDDVPLFYLNSDYILTYKPEVEPVYYMKARPWAHYPGPYGKLPIECPFNITAGRFEAFHIKHLAQRRKFFAQASAW